VTVVAKRMREIVARGWIWAALPLLIAALLLGCGQTSAPTGEERREPRAPAKVERPRQASEERYDLAQDEERGGHTLRKHVGRSDGQLRERLQQERNISAASTWTDREMAETTVAAALRDQWGWIKNWERRGYPRANLALHYDAGRVIGRSLRRGEEQTVECRSAVIVLRGDGPDGFFVLTTYPEARQ
jgi:hypothetical protein